eukprot:TRINITY_DN13818_c0_g1_i5.p1 TRINITY_DN13818_c0_g1~~TRINITY_DN13818_c0_g1_i5.p1  ORF type:complete len:221 (-),score=31.71 TRINITY_DN13818_c0_g1_i5:88-750(-)
MPDSAAGSGSRPRLREVVQSGYVATPDANYAPSSSSNSTSNSVNVSGLVDFSNSSRSNTADEVNASPREIKSDEAAPTARSGSDSDEKQKEPRIPGLCRVCKKIHDEYKRPSRRRRLVLKTKVDKILEMEDEDAKIKGLRFFMQHYEGAYACRLISNEVPEEMIPLILDGLDSVGLPPGRLNPGHLGVESAAQRSSSSHFRQMPLQPGLQRGADITKLSL